MNREQTDSLSNFKNCVENAPDGTYEAAKSLDEVIRENFTRLMMDIRALGLKADACDRAFELEAAMYHYAKISNADSTLFPTAEGFGSAMNGPARERVIAQAERNRNFLHGVNPQFSQLQEKGQGTT